MPLESIRIGLTVFISATPERVFHAITGGAHEWWGTAHLESADATDLIMEPKVGGRFYESWNPSDSDRSGALLGTVVAIQHPRLVRLQGPFGMSSRAVFSCVAFEIFPGDEYTTLKFSHDLVGDITEHEKRLSKGRWRDLLLRLKSFLEEGFAEGVRADHTVFDED